MKDISECIGDIGRAGSLIFSALDLTAGFWQQLLSQESQLYTSFMIPCRGQFQWVTTPMGLGAVVSYREPRPDAEDL